MKSMKKVKKILYLLSLGLLFCFATSVKASEEIGQDVMLVVDASYSMQSNDPNHNIYDAIQYIASISVGNNNRFGYVLYNDSIIRDQGLQKVTNQSEIDGLINSLKTIEPIKGTDVGLGLKTGQRLLNLGGNKDNHTMMIVLSDGDVETDATNPNRSQQAVEDDFNQVVDTAGIPIYVIQYSEVEHRDKAPMNTWSDRTGAKHYTAENRDQLLAAIMDIYSHQTKMSFEKDSLKSEKSKESTTYTLTIPTKKTETKRVKEIIVTMQADSAIKEMGYNSEDGLTVKESNHQAIIKITNPKKESYQLTYKTESNHPVITTTLTKMTDIPKPKPKVNWWLLLGLLVGGIGIGVIFGILVMNKKKVVTNPEIASEPVNYFFTDSLECCFIKTPDEEEIPIQNWSATIFMRSKRMSLYDLLVDEKIREKMPDSKKVLFRVGRNNTLEMRLKGSVEGIQQGREIPTGVWTTLSLQKSAYLIFIADVLELEVHIRKTSTTINL
ncbi:hypothetical protein RyT2_20700 [Pseudolactococcus yaeyamensis]